MEAGDNSQARVPSPELGTLQLEFFGSCDKMRIEIVLDRPGVLKLKMSVSI